MRTTTKSELFYILKKCGVVQKVSKDTVFLQYAGRPGARHLTFLDSH